MIRGRCGRGRTGDHQWSMMEPADFKLLRLTDRPARFAVRRLGLRVVVTGHRHALGLRHLARLRGEVPRYLRFLQRPNLRFEEVVLPFQVVDVLLMGGILATHKLDVLRRLLEYLSPARDLLTLQRRHRIPETREAVLDVIPPFPLQRIVVCTFLCLRIILHIVGVPLSGVGIVAFVALDVDVSVIVTHYNLFSWRNKQEVNKKFRQVSK